MTVREIDEQISELQIQRKELKSQECERRKEEMRQMRENGLTLNEIGQEFGVTRQRIQQLTSDMHTRGRRLPAVESCIYPNIANWLRLNRYTYSAFANLLGYNNMTVFRWMTGRCQPHKEQIDAILNKVEMPYEVAFARAFG